MLMPMDEATVDPQQTLSEIRRLLDDFDSTNADEPLASRISDLIAGFDSWTDLAIRRLHEIHRLQGNECESCGKHLDPNQSGAS